MHLAGRYVNILTLLLLVSRITGRKAEASFSLRAVDHRIGPPSAALSCQCTKLNSFREVFLPEQCSTADRPVSGELQALITSTATPVPITEKDASTQGRSIATSSLASLATVTESAPPVLDTLKPSRIEPWRSGSTTLTPTGKTDEDGSSPLDNAHFLSFEEWKNQNLARVGQSADQLRHARVSPGSNEARRSPNGIQNALDALGEDVEIELNFDGFGAPKTVPESPSPRIGRGTSEVRSTSVASLDLPSESIQAQRGVRSKDAGKTCKERFNYASFDCAANVLKTNPKCKSSSSVLVENKDNYMLNVCSEANKFLIVELCDDILVDTVVLANFEFFSSMFRTFRVSVSDRYPVKIDRWRELGVFEARNTREVQAFFIENPLIWARYLRVEFLTHYGNEYYCPVSLLRVHGTTMMEEYRHEEEVARGEEDLHDELDPEDKMQEVILPESGSSHSLAGDLPTTTPDVEEKKPEVSQTQQHSEGKSAVDTANDGRHVISTTASSIRQNLSQDTCPLEHTSNRMFVSINATESVCPVNAAGLSSPGSTKLTQPSVSSNATNLPTHKGTSSMVSRSSTTVSDVPSVTSSVNSFPSAGAINNESDIGFTELSPLANSRTKQSSAASESTHVANSTTSINAMSSASSSVSIKDASRSTSSTQPPSPNPSTQESFFKSIHKRLSALETNSTLSLQYIESQSFLLRDAFTAAAKQQLSKTEHFLESLNMTVLNELVDFRRSYDQLRQSTLSEVEVLGERWEREMKMVGRRVGGVVEEVVWLERIVIVQGILVVLCLGLLLFPRAGPVGSGGLDAYSHAKTMLKSSRSSLKLPFEGPPDSHGTPTRPNSVSSLRKRFWTRSSSPDAGLRSDDEHIRFRSSSPDSSPPVAAVESEVEGQGSSPCTLRRTSIYLTPSPSDSPEPEGKKEPGSEHLRSTSGPATPTGTRNYRQSELEWQECDVENQHNGSI